VLATCRELGIGFVAYSPLGRGFLTGRIRRTDDLPADDVRSRHPRFQEANLARNLALVEHVEMLARGKRCTPAQLALAWVLAQGTDVVPIPGTKRRRHLEENVGALDVRLTPDELRTIDRAIPRNSASGLRYPEAAMRSINI
jgi:aryl-alcohol dehydrogenase-like predicted oxidoreductase